MVSTFFQLVSEYLIPQVWSMILILAPVWVPIVLALVLWQVFIRYTRAKHLLSREYVLLEIKLPRDIYKSPLAMELFITSLYQIGGEATWIDTYIKGKTRDWFSLEITSVEGQIHFYVWGPKGYKNFIETNIYSQFPEVSINEVPDYTANVKYSDKLAVWGCDFKLTKPDPYPIKTYVDYGLGDDPKEEYKIDPMTPMLEFLGSLKKGEQVWYQILIRSPKNHHIKKLEAEAKEEIKKIREESVMKAEDDENPRFPNPTKGQTETIAAIERAQSKLWFQTGIRAIYLTTEKFEGTYISAMLGAFRHFSSNTLNGIRPTGWLLSLSNYPWGDFMDFFKNRAKVGVYTAFRKRAFFHPPFSLEWFSLNIEELATIFHFPGSVAGTPTLERIPSKRAEAPANLPI